MTGIFEERDRAYEAKWAHDEETRFRILALRNEFLGRWAADQLGLLESSADIYVQAMIKTGMLGSGRDPVFDKIRNDFAAHKISYSEHALHRKMEELFHLASQELTRREAS